MKVYVAQYSEIIRNANDLVRQRRHFSPEVYRSYEAAVAHVQEEYNAEGEFFWTDRSLDVHHRSQWWGTTKDGATSVQITEVELEE